MQDRKIQRLLNMKKWRTQSHIPGLNLIKVSKDMGRYYYLAGYASQQRIYEVYQRLQSHSYKVYISDMRKSIYKRLIQGLIKTDDFQTQAYEKLKITSTELKESTA
jgi:hypothetical protein